MLIVVNDNQECVFLCDLRQDQIDQIRQSIMAARRCEFQAMRELALDLSIGILCIHSELVLVMGWDEVTFLMAVMIDSATQKVTREKASLINEINQALTCAVEMGICG